MYVGRDFSPADPVESDVYAFDFRKDLAAGETLSSATFVLSVIDGTDSTPGSRLTGVALVSGTQARQRIAGLLPDTTYRLEAVVTTSQANTKALWSRIECRG